MTRSLSGMKLKHISVVMDALVGLIQKDDFPLTELILAENKLKNDIHDFINALGSNQSLQKLGASLSEASLTNRINTISSVE